MSLLLYYGGKEMSKILTFKTAENKAAKLKELVREGHFVTVSDGLNTALTLLLEKYGKLGREVEQ
jgi:Arc/MetJ-type ribon-helix-helix transcriptional regulator